MEWAGGCGRRGAGLTQKQLADELGVESITVSRWEREVTSPSLPRLRRIAELTGTTVSDLVRAPDAASAHAVELAALREELAETRQLVDRVAPDARSARTDAVVRERAVGVSGALTAIR